MLCLLGFLILIIIFFSFVDAYGTFPRKSKQLPDLEDFSSMTDSEIEHLLLANTRHPSNLRPLLRHYMAAQPPTKVFIIIIIIIITMNLLLLLFVGCSRRKFSNCICSSHFQNRYSFFLFLLFIYSFIC